MCVVQVGVGVLAGLPLCNFVNFFFSFFCGFACGCRPTDKSVLLTNPVFVDAKVFFFLFFFNTLMG